MIVVDAAGVARVVDERRETKRDRTSIQHITVDSAGRTFCERCGASARATEREAHDFRLSSGTIPEFIRAHARCKPTSYVS